VSSITSAVCCSRYNPNVRFTIREYRVEDFQTLYDIDRACFPPGIAYSRLELAHYMKVRGAFTLVAETKRKTPEIAGFIVAQRHPKGMGHIITIDILKEFRRDGLGTIIMEAAEDRLKAAGCDAIFLEVAVDNLSAIKFYKNLGYFTLKRIPHYYPNKLDAFMMVKRLTSAPPLS
jgi:[ribosomal protein S18]-alanine N-acetyltransferase